MSEERRRALEAFSRLSRDEATAGLMNFALMVHVAAIATGYPEQALIAALISEKEAPE